MILMFNALSLIFYPINFTIQFLVVQYTNTRKWRSPRTMLMHESTANHLAEKTSYCIISSYLWLKQYHLIHYYLSNNKLEGRRRREKKEEISIKLMKSEMFRNGTRSIKLPNTGVHVSLEKLTTNR